MRKRSTEHQRPAVGTGTLALLLCALLTPGLLRAQGSLASQPIYSLSGTVVNSATGEPIPHALVRTNGVVRRNTFSDSEGHFQIDAMPQCQVSVVAQKPGFYTQQDENGAGPNWIDVGAGTGAITIKLSPQSAIFGRVVDSAGLPIEHMPMRLTARAIREGRKRWESRGMTESDEDGRYRFPGLMPGAYYVAAGPRQGELQLMPAGEKQKNGFPHVYYPGVPDLNSAPPIQLGPGQQMQADFSLSAAPVYQITGTISGHTPDQGVGFQVLTASGDELSLPTNFNMETGVFTVEGIPAGNYVLRALSQSGTQPVRSEVRLNVNSNVDGLRLTLAPAVSIPVVVRADSHAGSGSTFNPQRPPISAQLVPTDVTNSEAFSAFDGDTMKLLNVDAGTYTVELRPQPPWYVQSASYGQSNALYEDITVSPGQGYPLEVTLRDDSATVSGKIKVPAGTSPTVTVVIAPQPLTRQLPRVLRVTGDNFTSGGLAPGEYYIFAFDQAGGLEFDTQDFVETYASQAAHVTLTANQTAQVQLDVIHPGKAE